MAVDWAKVGFVSIAGAVFGYIVMQSGQASLSQHSAQTAAMSPVAANQPDMDSGKEKKPNSEDFWRELKKSGDKGDKQIVAQIDKANWWDLCARYGRMWRKGSESREFKAIAGFLRSEGYISVVDRRYIGAETVEIGMTQCGVMARIGLPKEINGTKTAAGSDSQMVYMRGRYRYIYTEQPRGVAMPTVTAIQD